jgi:hypothetical protein
MSRLYILILALLPAIPALGQKQAPDFGKIDKADLEMTSCDVEPEADLYTLIKTGEITFSPSGTIFRHTVFRFRVKILSDKMVGRANVRLFYEHKAGLQDIDEVRGITFNLDEGGKIVTSKLDKSGIFTKQMNADISELDFTLPDVKKGSVIEYTYRVSTKQYYMIDNWNFQDGFPTRFCQLSITVPHYIDFAYTVHRTLPLDIRDARWGESTKVFTMENIPSLGPEPFMSAFKDYLQHVEFKLSSIRVPGQPEMTYNTSWKRINDDLLARNDFGAQLDKNVPNTEDLDAQLVPVGDSLARMTLVYNYVRHHMEHQATGNDRFSQEGVKSAWEARKGGTGSINLLLINLLRKAGLRAYPLLVSTRKHGAVNIANPELAQFNEVLALVWIGDKKYVLDGTDKFTPSLLIPYDVQYSKGFIIDRDSYGWVDLYDAGDAFRISVIVTGEITDKGILKGSASIYNYAYSKVPRCRILDEGMDRFKTIFYTGAYKDFRVDSLAVTNMETDSLPLDQELRFRTRLNSSGDYLFYAPALFLGLERNPFLAAHRFSDVDFGYVQHYTISGSLRLPDGFRLDTLPKNIRMIMPDTSIVLERQMQVDDNVLSYRIDLDIKRPVYFADEYDNFREFYKRLFATLNDPVVIRKKS